MVRLTNELRVFGICDFGFIHRKTSNGNSMRRHFSGRTVISAHLKRAAGNVDELCFDGWCFQLAWIIRPRRFNRRVWPKDKKSADAASDQEQNTQPEN